MTKHYDLQTGFIHLEMSLFTSIAVLSEFLAFFLLLPDVNLGGNGGKQRKKKNLSSGFTCADILDVWGVFVFIKCLLASPDLDQTGYLTSGRKSLRLAT